MILQPHYTTITDFAGLGLAHTCDPSNFDDACDAFAEQMSEGRETVVFRMEPPTGSKAGAMIDVTDDAIARVKTRILSRAGYPDLPEWLEAL